MGRTVEKFLNRDLSWLEFNARVLDEAADRSNPLLERLKFISIFSSNLDEFYMVRMAGLLHQIRSGTASAEEFVNAENLMPLIEARIRTLSERQYRCLCSGILPSLEKEGIRFVHWDELSPQLRENMRKRFISDALPVMTPIGIDPTHPFPLIRNLGLELLIRLTRPGELKPRFAVMEIPPVLPRFCMVEERDETLSFIPMEELAAANLDLFFNGCTVCECAPFRITRDMDFSIDEDSIDDLLTEMQVALQKNAKRRVIRLEISSKMSPASRKWLCERLGIPEREIFSCRGLLNLKAFFQIAGMDRPDLLDKPMPPLESIHISPDRSICDTIRDKGPFLVHHPYESFSPVIRFLEEAAADPNVLAIKQTLYRVSGNSPVVAALKRAAANGKQVTVLVELKARFDEENNINWAMELDRAGAHVVYGIANLKVHCKTLLVVRREPDGIHRYMHIGTGNYNDKTARLYTDLGFFTDDPALAADCTSLFNVITGFSIPPAWNKLLVAPFNMLDKLLFLIDREAELSTPQNPGSIRIKANALIDPEVMEHLYAAAKKHVKIELSVRGICGINPAALPEKARANISVVSVLDRFLEHSRIYRFGNNGTPEYYIGSADMMQRNLRRRIEVLAPVENAAARRELDFILDTVFADKRKGRRLTDSSRYTRTCSGLEKWEPTRSQTLLYQYYAERLKRSNNAGKRTRNLVVFNSPERAGHHG